MAPLPLSGIIGRVHAVQPSYTDQRIISLSAFSLFPSGNNQHSSANGAGCQISNQLVLCAPEQHRMATPGLCNILPLGTPHHWEHVSVLRCLEEGLSPHRKGCWKKALQL